MKKILFLIASVGFSLSNFAQQEVPNGGFETWTTDPLLGFTNPQSWSSLNVLSVVAGADVSVSQSSDSKSGQFATSIKTVIIDFQGEVDTVGILFTGSIDLFSQTVTTGYAYNKRPLKFTYAYKYSPIGDDEGVAQALFFKNGELIGGVEYFMEGANSNYITVNEDIFFEDPFLFPDTAVVLFTSGVVPGSVLLVDDVNFTGTQSSSISEASTTMALPTFKCYPNPTSDFINIEVEFSGNATFNLISMTGKTVMNKVVNTNNKSVSLSHLPAGKYIATLDTGSQKYKQIISVIK
jgi:hypothetical protein